MLLGRKNRKNKLGMCYFADENAGGGAGNNSADQNKQDGNSATDKINSEVKFTQDDINKMISERLAAEKSKHEKEIAEIKAQHERDAELAKMNEKERLDAQFKDLQKKYQEEKDKNELAIQTEETRKMLEESNVPASFLKFVLVPKDAKQTQLNINELKTVFDAEVQKGVEAQIKPHMPKGNTVTVNSNDKKKISGPSYSGFNLQNSIAEYYDKQK